MRNKKRMLAAGLIAVALLSTVSGCGSTTGNMQDPQSIQGTTGAAGGTVQGSRSTGNASDTASQNNSNTADHNAQDNSSGAGTAQTGNSDSSGTSQAGVSQHATAGSATMINGGITEQEAKSIAAGNAGVTEEQIQYITVKQDWDDGRARYEVEFTAAGVEYDYELGCIRWTHPLGRLRSDRQGIPCITEWYDKFPERSRHIADSTGRCFHRDSKTDRHGQDPWHRCRKHLHPSGL